MCLLWGIGEKHSTLSNCFIMLGIWSIFVLHVIQNMDMELNTLVHALRMTIDLDTVL